jgi:cobalt/nickel transport system permease protein
MRRVSSRISTRTFVIAGIAVALVLAFFVAPHASSSPDGLERVAADTGMHVGVTDHALADSPLANYSVQGVDSSGVGTGLAGIAGVGVTFALGFGVLSLVRVAKRGRTPPSASAR